MTKNPGEAYLKEIRKYHGTMSKTVCVDLDGVITDFMNCKEGCDYSGYPERYHVLKRDRCPVNKDAKRALSMIKKMGFTILIQTSRIEAERLATEKWLDKHKIPYDGLVMNKPCAFCYIDDLAVRFESWEDTIADLFKMLVFGEEDGK